MPRLGPTESLVSLRHAGLAGITRRGRRPSRSARRRRSPQVGREVEFLRDAIESIASPTIRNLATVGGNLFVPQPHGDLAVCLLALDAKVHLADGREVGVLEAEGLVTAVSFTVPERWFYTKAMRRRQNSASIVTVASDGTRIALGGVAPTPGPRARRRGGARRAATSSAPPSSRSRPPTRSTTPSPAPGTAAASCPSTSARALTNAL